MSRLANIFALILLASAVAIGGLWVRSYWAADGLAWPVDGGACGLRSGAGRLAFLSASSVDESRYPFPAAAVPTGYRSGPPRTGLGFAPAWAFAGFGHTAGDAFALRLRESTVPHWFVVVLLVAWPVARWIRGRRRRKCDPGGFPVVTP